MNFYFKKRHICICCLAKHAPEMPRAVRRVRGVPANRGRCEILKWVLVTVHLATPASASASRHRDHQARVLSASARLSYECQCVIAIEEEVASVLSKVSGIESSASAAAERKAGIRRSIDL